MATSNILSIRNAGLVAYDGSATFNGRTISATSSKISVTNGSGISGNPSIDAIEANFTLNNIGGTLGVSKGGTGATSFSSNTLVVANGTTAFASLGSATNGQIPIGSTGNVPVLATLTAGSNVSITNGAGSIIISASGGSGSITFTDQGSPTTISSNAGYYVTAAVTLTLPASPSQGDICVVISDVAGIVTVTANTGQAIRLGSMVTSTAGSVASAERGDAITLRFRAATSTWISETFVGNWNF